MDEVPISRDPDSTGDNSRSSAANPVEDSVAILALPEDGSSGRPQLEYTKSSFRQAMELRVLRIYRKTASGEILSIHHSADRRSAGFLGFFLPLICVEFFSYALWDFIGAPCAIALMVSGFLLVGFMASRWERYAIPSGLINRALKSAPPGSIVVACRLPERRRAELCSALEIEGHRVLLHVDHAGSFLEKT